MNHLLPRFALAASVFVSACSAAPRASDPAPVITPTPVIVAPAKRPVPMICEDRRGREISCAPSR